MLSWARFKILNWGRKTGKTEFEIEELIAIATLKPFTHGKTPKLSYIGETRKEAKRIAWDRAKARTKPIWYKQPNESNLELYLRRNDALEYATIFFDGWENVSALIGEEFDHLCLDEVAKFKDFITTWKNVLRPTLTPRKGSATFISRPQGFNHWWVWCMDALQKMKDGIYYYSHATAYDNPHIDPAELEEAKGDLDQDTFAQEYLADFRKLTGLVYKEFDRNRHVIDRETATKMMAGGIIGKRAGIDWGWTNPTSSHPIVKTRDGDYIVVGEYYESHKDTPDILAVLKTGGVDDWYPDPAEPDRCDQAKKAGLRVHDVSKDVSAGIDTVQSLFRQNRLYILNECTWLIAELEGYRWKEKKPGLNVPEEPVKENDHACDDIRYCLHMWEHQDQGDAAEAQKKRLAAKQQRKRTAPRGAAR